MQHAECRHGHTIRLSQSRVQMWQGWAQSRCRCGSGEPQFRCTFSSLLHCPARQCRVHTISPCSAAAIDAWRSRGKSPTNRAALVRKAESCFTTHRVRIDLLDEIGNLAKCRVPPAPTRARMIVHKPMVANAAACSPPCVDLQLVLGLLAAMLVLRYPARVRARLLHSEGPICKF